MNRILSSLFAALLVVPATAQQLDTPMTKLVPMRSVAPAVRLVSSVELAANRPLDEAAKNAVIVDMPIPGGSHRGSGIYLGDRYVATANHVVEAGRQGTVTFRDGRRHGFVVHSVDTQWDLAILQITEHPSLPGVAISSREVTPGETVYSMGFGNGFRIFGGPVRGFVGNRNGGSDWFHHSNGAVSGDSGGGVVRVVGNQVELVGCLWGTGGGDTYASRTRRFRLLCRPLLPRLAQWRANRLARLGVQPQQPNPYDPYANCPTCPPQSSPGSAPITPPTDTPYEPIPDPVPDTPVASDEQIAAAVEEYLRNNPPPAGPAGPVGSAGRDGQDGNDGTDAVVSNEMLQAAIAEYFKTHPNTISLSLVDQDGRVLDTDTVNLGGTLKLQLYQKERTNASR